MPTPKVTTSIAVHLHRPAPGTASAIRLRDDLVLIDLCGNQVGTPAVDAMFGSWEEARGWVASLMNEVLLVQAEEQLASRVADEIGAPV